LHKKNKQKKPSRSISFQRDGLRKNGQPKFGTENATKMLPLQTEFDFSGRYFRSHGQSVLDFQLLNLTVAELHTVVDQPLPGGMQLAHNLMSASRAMQS